MAEEFYMSVSFTLPDSDRAEQLKTLIEHFDLGEIEEAKALLSEHNLAVAQGMIEDLTAEHSCYPNGYDLAQMYADTYNDSVDDFELEIDDSGIKAEISIEGHDREADDFCAALVLILFALGAKRIKAQAGAPMWNASWIESENGAIELVFEAEE